MSIKTNKIGIYEKAIPTNFNWRDKIKVAKSAGFDFIEISIDESNDRLERLNWTQGQRQNLVLLLKENSMRIDSMCLSGHRLYPFGSENKETRNKAYEIMDKALILAVDLGIKNIQLAGYDVYYEDSNEETIKNFITGLRYSAKKAEEYGIILSLEIMDTWLLGTISRALEYVKKVNSPNLLLYPDLGNLTQWSDDPSSELVKGINYIVAIHLKDTLPGIFKCVPFGKGSVKFNELFKTLKKLNYDKPFLIEMWADNSIEYTMDDSVSELSKAKEWLINRM